MGGGRRGFFESGEVSSLQNQAGMQSRQAGLDGEMRCPGEVVVGGGRGEIEWGMMQSNGG
jgi:hypothetical protein